MSGPYVVDQPESETLGVVLRDIWKERNEKGLVLRSIPAGIFEVKDLASSMGRDMLEESAKHLIANNELDERLLRHVAAREKWSESIMSKQSPRFKLASWVHLLELDEMIYTEQHGIGPWKILDVILQKLAPHLRDWKLQFGTHDFQTFKLYCQFYMRNWLMNNSIWEERAIDYVKLPDPQEFKRAVLYKCSINHKARLRKAYFVDKKFRERKIRGEDLGEILKEAWTTRHEQKAKGTRQVNPAVVDVYEIAKLAGKNHMAKSFAWKVAEGTATSNVYDADSLDKISTKYEAKHGYKLAPLSLRRMYNLATRMYVLEIDKVIFYSNYAATYEMVDQMVEWLFGCIQKWKLQFGMPEMGTFGGFCRYYSRLYLRFCGDPMCFPVIQNLGEPAATFQDSVLYQCTEDRKISIRSLGQLRIAPHVRTPSKKDDTTSQFLLDMSQRTPLAVSVDESNDGTSSYKRRRVESQEEDGESDDDGSEAPSFGEVLNVCWKAIIQNHGDVFNGPVVDQDLLLLSRLNCICDSIFRKLNDWKQASGIPVQKMSSQYRNDLKVEIVATYEAEYGREFPKQICALEYCRLACRIKMLQLDRIVYMLAGDNVFESLFDPIAFLFSLMVDYSLKGDNDFVEFSKYYLFHALRLRSDGNLFQQKGMQAQEIKAAIQSQCTTEQISKICQSILIDPLQLPIEWWLSKIPSASTAPVVLNLSVFTKRQRHEVLQLVRDRQDIYIRPCDVM